VLLTVGVLVFAGCVVHLRRSLGTSA
jgi:hypothetical protein